MFHFVNVYEKNIWMKTSQTELTHYSPELLFYTPWNIRKPKPEGFLMFSGGIEKQHRAVMA